MRTHTVQIGDGAGNGLKVVVSLADFTYNGSWRALEYGLLKYTSGVVVEFNDSDAYNGNASAYFYGPDGVSAGWGVRLGGFDNKLSGVNDAGTGAVAQPWVLQLSPGAISWALAD